MDDGGIEQLIKMVANLKITMEEGFKNVDRRFEKIEEKLAEHDERFEKIERKLVEHDKRFEEMDNKFEELDNKLDRIDKKVNEHDQDFDRIENKFIKTLKLIGHDVQNNKRHIEQLENNDDYYKISE